MTKFKEGNKQGRKISGDVATEMQKRSAAARKKNRTLREALLEALQEDSGGGYTKLDILARKAMENHRNGKLSFKDLKDLSAVLGEATINVKGDVDYVIHVDNPEQAERLANLGGD